MNIDNFKKVCIVGWGLTGFYLTSLLLSLKRKVFVTEAKERKSFSPRLIDTFKRRGVEFEFGGHSKNFLKKSQLVVLSPGVDINNHWLRGLCFDLKIPFLGEVEFSSWLTKAKFIAVTGTNGKTTTSFLIYKILKERRKRVFLGGNIGIPLSSFVLNTRRGDCIVLEVSSFQLETIIQWRPYVAAVLNIEDDHLDRYPNFRDYFSAKMNIFKNQKREDWAVLNANCSLLKGLREKIRPEVIYFSSEFPNDNFSCAYRVGSIFAVGRSDCQKVFSQFKGLPHRLQCVRRIGGVHFINDSKATNPSSAIWALKNLKRSFRRTAEEVDKCYVTLIAGGKDKGLDYSSLIPYLAKVRKINLLGEAANKIKKTLGAYVDAQVFSSIDDAVAESFKGSKPGDVILFSPMCASFDMFSNYRERGSRFIEAVNRLTAAK